MLYEPWCKKFKFRLQHASIPLLIFFYNVTLILHVSHLKQYRKMKKLERENGHMILGAYARNASSSSACNILQSHYIWDLVQIKLLQACYSLISANFYYTFPLILHYTHLKHHEKCLSLSDHMRSSSASNMLWTHSVLTSPLTFLSLSTMWD